MTDHVSHHDGSVPDPPTREQGAKSTPMLPFEELLEPTGLLWLINATVFHPHGYAMSIDIDPETGKAIGWRILGDGKQRWTYEESEAMEAMLDRRFNATRRILK